MDQIMLLAICHTIVGRNGKRLPAYADILSAYIYGLFADYFACNPHVTRKTIYKYANGTTPYPHFLIRHYGGVNDYRRTLSDMMNIVDSCPSITQLRQIQDELQQWVSVYLPPEEAYVVNRNYVIHNANRRQIAEYLADVMHHAICRIPSDTHRRESVLD